MATVPAVEYLENVLAEKFDNALVVDAKPEGAAEGKENAAPALPLGGKPSGLDLVGLVSQSTPSKKSWNRNAAAIPGTGAATSPSAASTVTPSNDHVMSVSPSSVRSAIEEAAVDPESTEKHAALKMLAEQYASAKKLHPNGSAELATALELVCVAAAKDLHPDPESLTFGDETDPVKRAAAIEQALRDIATPHIPVVDGQITSIGSIPYVTGGISNCVGLCRFHVKGKCFDGVLCRFSHISRERYMNEGVLNGGQRGERSPEKEDTSRRSRKGAKTTPAKTPPRSQAPFAAPLLTLPTPTAMPMPMMQMPMPMPQMPTPSKPQSREQAALCELLSSLDVHPEQPAVPPAMPNPYAYGAMPMMPMPMMTPYAYGYDPRMMDPMYAQYCAQWQQQQCPTVQPVQSLQAQARRKKKGI